MDDDGGRLELERLRQGGAQRVHTLAVRPNRQLAVLVKRKAARGRDRRVREIAARVRSFKALPAFRISRLRPEGPIDRRSLQQPVGLLLGCGRRLDVLPGDVVHRGGARRFHGSFDFAEDREKISMAHEFNGALGCAANGVFVDRTDRRATVRLANDTRVHHAVDLHVVNENALPENLRWQVEAGAVRADGLEIADWLFRNGAGCLDYKVDGAGKGPVVLSGRFAVAIDAAVA